MKRDGSALWIVVDDCLALDGLIELRPEDLVWRKVRQRQGSIREERLFDGCGAEHPFGVVLVKRVRLALFLDIDGTLRLWCGDRILDAEDPALQVRRWDFGLLSRFKVTVAGKCLLDRFYDPGRVDIWGKSVDVCRIIAHVLGSKEERRRFKVFHELVRSGVDPMEAARVGWVEEQQRGNSVGDLKLLPRSGVTAVEKTCARSGWAEKLSKGH